MSGEIYSMIDQLESAVFDLAKRDLPWERYQRMGFSRREFLGVWYQSKDLASYDNDDLSESIELIKRALMGTNEALRDFSLAAAEFGKMRN